MQDRHIKEGNQAQKEGFKTNLSVMLNFLFFQADVNFQNFFFRILRCIVQLLLFKNFGKVLKNQGPYRIEPSSES